MYRLARPAGIILGAVLGVTLLNFISFETIFYALAIVVFFGLKESLVLKDTK